MGKKLSKKFINRLYIHSDTLLDKIFKILILLILGVYFIVNVCIYFRSFIFLITSIFFLFFLFILFKVSKILHSDKLSLLLLVLISSFVLISWNLIYQPNPVLDYKVIWDGAHQIITGDFYNRALDKSDYFCFFNFQIPYTYLISLLLRIFDSIITLKITEIIILVFTYIILYKILRLYCSFSESFFGSILFSFYPYIFIGSGVINNQHIGLLLGATAIYIILKKDSYIKYIISSVLLVIGNLLRSTVIIIFLSIAFTLLLQGLFEKKTLLGFLLFVSVYLSLNEIINIAFISFSLAPYGIKANDMNFKFLLGLTGSGVTHTPSTDAEHTSLFYDLQYYNFDYDKYSVISRDYLINLIVNGKISVKFLLGKMIHFISAIDNQYIFGDSDFNKNHLAVMDFLNYWGNITYITTIIGSILYTLRQKIVINNSKFIIPAVSFCVYFVVYIFIEVQTRYRYEQYFMLFLISTPTIYLIMNKIDIQISKHIPFIKQANNKTTLGNTA